MRIPASDIPAAEAGHVRKVAVCVGSPRMGWGEKTAKWISLQADIMLVLE